jgi:hypothetical protein
VGENPYFSRNENRNKAQISAKYHFWHGLCIVWGIPADDLPEGSGEKQCRSILAMHTTPPSQQ